MKFSTLLLAIGLLGTAPAWAGEWVQCAPENGECNFSGEQRVAYGIDGRWTYRNARDGIDCNNRVFGDPAPNQVKICMIYNPWVRCAAEGQPCRFQGNKEVVYGKNGTWTSGVYRDGVRCSNEVFGDPLPGVVKECRYKGRMEQYVR